jgi:Protein of unknown function (DUF2846)
MQAKSTLIVLLAGMLSAFSAANAQQPTVSQDSSGTSSATGQSIPPSPPAGKALVYVYRQRRTVGAAGYDRSFVNHDYLAALHNSNYAQREVPQGTVVFTTLSRLNRTFLAQAELMTLQKRAKERFRMDVEAGKTYYVKWSVGGKMKLVDSATGATEMSGLHLAKD